MKYNTQHTAHHEAGHTVIGYRFGLFLSDVTIVPDSARHGVVHI